MTQVSTVTTTATTTSSQQGTQLSVGSQSNTVTVGNYVTDVSLQPYMAASIVSFYAYGMRPNQLIHAFFENINVDQYCSPGVRASDNTYVTNITNSSDYTQIQTNGTWGTSLYSDKNGVVTGQFNIPGGTFKTGSTTFELCDVISLALGASSITTLASAAFTASNLSVTKQTVTLTTVDPIISSVPVANTIVASNVNSTTSVAPPTIIYNVVGVLPTREPLAQSFQINTPDNSAGVFATSIELWFNQISMTANNGVTVYICDTLNGYPDTDSILPFSRTHLPMSNISISNNASTVTKFTFESPVFLNNGQLYAFVVAPDNSDPDYQVWVANLGNFDVSTNNQVYSQPAVGGTAFYGATASEWTALQTEYIKFNLNVAQFTSGYGDAYFNNTAKDYLPIYNLGYVNTSVSVLPGDYIYQATNSTPSTANTQINGILQFFDTTKDIFYVSNSSGNFVGNSFVQVHRFANSSVATPNTTTLIGYANTFSLYNPVVDALVGQFATIAPAGTSLYFEYFGTSNSYVGDTNAHAITNGYETEFYDKERIVVSRSNEISNFGGNSSLTIHSHLTTDSIFLSPIIDLVKNKQLIIANQVNPVAFVYNEYFNYGISKSKYISEIITLAQGQDSEDIQIIISAFRPSNSDIKVYVKFLNGSDTDPISAKTWTPLINQSPTLYSSTSNPSDIKEFVFTTSNTNPNSVPVVVSTGTFTVANNTTTVTGIGTAFTTQLQVGWFLSMPANSTFIETTRQIVAIANNTSLTLNAPFNGNYTTAPFNIVAPPTTAWLSSNTTTLVSGTVTTSVSNNVIIGSGTSFLANFVPGSIIEIAGDEQVVISVSNNTYLTVGTPWTVAVAGANAYLQTSSGLTYFNNNADLYSTYLQFQIKVVLQSNDSSKVPLMDSLQALALQL